MIEPSASTRMVKQVYAASGVVAFAATFAPLWSPVKPGDLYESMSLWDATGETGGDIAVLGIIMLLGLVATVLAAAASPQPQPWVPFVVIVIAAFAILLLITKPAAGDPEPALGTGGSMLFGVSILLAATAAADLVLQAISRQSATTDA